VESEKQPSSALLAEQGASTCTITALQVVASLLGHVRLSTARVQRVPPISSVNE